MDKYIGLRDEIAIKVLSGLVEKYGAAPDKIKSIQDTHCDELIDASYLLADKIIKRLPVTRKR